MSHPSRPRRTASPAPRSAAARAVTAFERRQALSPPTPGDAGWAVLLLIVLWHPGRHRSSGPAATLDSLESCVRAAFSSGARVPSAPRAGLTSVGPAGPEPEAGRRQRPARSGGPARLASCPTLAGPVRRIGRAYDVLLLDSRGASPDALPGIRGRLASPAREASRSPSPAVRRSTATSSRSRKRTSAGQVVSPACRAGVARRVRGRGRRRPPSRRRRRRGGRGPGDHLAGGRPDPDEHLRAQPRDPSGSASGWTTRC